MKKILLLFVALLATTTVWAADFITDVMVIGGSKSDVNSLKTTYTAQGWTVIDQDLNAGCGSSSDYIYLLYKTASETSTSATFITDFLISTATTPPNSFMNNGRVYYLVSYDGSDYFKNNKGDLNSHCGSNSATIHLYYTKDYADDLGTVRSITFNATQAGGVPVAGATTGYDLNSGAGGNYIYMHAEKSQGWTYTKNSAGTLCYINGYDGPKANITSITIPTTLDGAQVANFTGSVFSGFTNLETMIFNENTIVSQMPSVNGLTKFKNVKTSNSLGNNNTPPSMTSIPASTFEGTAVMVINLTAVTSIGNYAFKGCSSLKDVYVSSTLNTIGKQVFYNCSSMAHLWFDGTEAQWNAVSKDSQWRTGAANFAEHWHCTVTFNANGHGTAPAAQTIWSNYDKATEPTVPTAPLCAFQGWYTDAACTNQWNFNTVVPGNMTLYAKWNTQYTYNSSTGALTLNWGEFNKDNKWGSDVPASSVQSVTATNLVSFTGDCSELFKDFTNCTSMDLNSVNTSNVTNMRSMFENCRGLSLINISNWNTGNVTNMSRMFYNCTISSYPLNISNWNTSNVTDMSWMFSLCKLLYDGPLNLSGWDTGNVTDISFMFYSFYSSYPLDLSGWNTSKVTNMTNMFMSCTMIPSINLAGWDTGNVTNMNIMFSGCAQLTTIYVTTSWSTANAITSSAMFSASNNLVGGMGTTFDSNYIDKTYARIDHGTSQPGYLTGVFKLTLPGDVTASPNPIFTLSGNKYYTAGTTVTLTYNGNVPEGKIVVFKVNGTAIEGNTFEMPLNDVTITATVTDPPQYTFNSETGVLALLWGEFNKDNKWGSDVPASSVKSVTATSQVSFTGDCSELFNGFTFCKIMDLDSVNTSNATNMSLMFQSCGALNTLNISSWDTGNVTNMKRMFSNSCLSSLDISGWNTSNVTDMSWMFSGCQIHLNPLDISGWDTGNVIYMNNMFYGFKNDLYPLNLSGWNTSNVTDMFSMFMSCTQTPSINLSGWDTGNVTNMSSMFSGCAQLTTIYTTTSWSAENATSSNNMFDRCNNLVGGMGTTYDENHINKEYGRIDHGTELPGYLTGVFSLTLPVDVTASATPVFTVGDTAYYTAGTTITLTYNGNVPEGKIVVFAVNGTAIEGNTFEMPLDNVTITATVTDPPQYTFNSTTGELALLWGEFNKDNKWGDDVPASAVTSVTATSEVSFTGDCSQLFYNFDSCESMDLNNVNTSAMTSAYEMFCQCEALTSLNISNWNTCNVTNMGGMFYDCISMTSFDISGWNTANVTNMEELFEDCYSMTSLDLSDWNTSNVTNLSYMFYYCSSMTSFDISGWNTANVTNMEGLFGGCSSLTSLDISDWNTSNVTNLSYMFNYCSSMTSFDILGWNTANVTNMEGLFANCSSLTSIDLSGWDTGNVINMASMFYGCSNLTTIVVGTDWSTEKVTTSGFMFDGCTSLVGGMGTIYDMYHTNKAYAHIDGGSANPGYLTASTPRYTYDSTTGALSLNWGAFNKDDKWGSEVIATDVTSVTATNQVNFTGDCSELFKGFTNCTSMDLNSVNTSSATNMTSMFENCSSLTSLDLSNWNTSNLSSMNSMFKSCTSLNSLNVSNFNTMLVYTMMSMFDNCSSIKTLDISGWDTRNLTNPDAMFQDCSKLKTIFAGGGWTTQYVYGSCDMFTGCTSLMGGMGTTYNASHTGKEYARIDGGPDNPGYFTDPNAEVVYGDVNGDGEVSTVDITAIYNFLLNGDETFPLYRLDVNGDGYVTSVDVTAVYDVLLGNYQPPVEHPYVDLGLPSGTLWATMNIGASSPEDYGDYFAWGETAPKNIYDWSTYKWCNGSRTTLTKYNHSSFSGIVDNKSELDPADDAATVNWGEQWQMPSKDQFIELFTWCTFVWTNINGVNGRKFTSKNNGASLFLPAAGRYDGSELKTCGLGGKYWSRMLGSSLSSDACILFFDSGGVGTSSPYRSYGQSVRAVRVAQK